MLPAKPPVTVVDDVDESRHESPDDTEEGGVSTLTDESPSPSTETQSQRLNSEQPPLPEESVPLSDQPPLPNEVPPPLSEQPPLPKESLPLSQPPLPEEIPPPLPTEPLPTEDDGWEPVWNESAQTFYFYNKYTQVTQWENPRVPEAVAKPIEDAGPPGASASSKKPIAGGYDPAIHGDYDPNADYARGSEPQVDSVNGQPTADTAAAYAATGAFNRFTGKWQSSDINPEKFSDENKSKRQMNAFFDVDAAANSHDGRSLKAERSGKRVSKAELKAFREKRREKKEEKKRAWLRD